MKARYRSSLFPPWGRLGQVVALNEKDDPPFLASIEPGKHQFAVENNLFRAPAAHHPPAAKDFLLLRHPSGRWELREASGVISVGQQEPNIRIPVPLSVPMRLCEEKRFCDYVLRELRRRHNRHHKSSPKSGHSPRLLSPFPSTSFDISFRAAASSLSGTACGRSVGASRKLPRASALTKDKGACKPTRASRKRPSSVPGSSPRSSPPPPPGARVRGRPHGLLRPGTPGPLAFLTPTHPSVPHDPSAALQARNA